MLSTNLYTFFLWLYKTSQCCSNCLDIEISSFSNQMLSTTCILFSLLNKTKNIYIYIGSYYFFEENIKNKMGEQTQFISVWEKQHSLSP